MANDKSTEPEPGRFLGGIHMPDWIEKKVSIGNIVALFGILSALIGFYYTTTLTQEHQSRSIAQLFEENKRFFAEIQRVQNVEQSARENIRQEMIQRSDRTTENQIKTIERMVAVETEIKGLRSDLSRVLDRLDGRGRN